MHKQKSALGKFLAKSRVDIGVSQKEMALALGVTAQYLSMIESGKKPFPDKRFSDVAHFLRLDDAGKDRLQTAIDFSELTVTFDFSSASTAAKECAVMFCQTFKRLSDRQMIQIRDVLQAKKMPISDRQ